MTAGTVTLCFVLALALIACNDDPDESTPTSGGTSSSTTTAPERPASPTTTAFDPASVEGEVEAAYLKSWDVYADAVYDLVLDQDALEEVYAEALLDVRREEILERIDEERAALVRVDHDYDIDVTGEETAIVIDSYVNHQILVDPETKEPIEQDPNATIVDAFTARLIDGTWVLVDLERVA